MHGHLGAARVRGQVQGAGAAAVTEGVGDELRGDQDRGVGSLGCDRRLCETFEEIWALSRASATDVAERTVATLTLIVSIRSPWSLGRQCPVLSAQCLRPGLRRVSLDRS